MQWGDEPIYYRPPSLMLTVLDHKHSCFPCPKVSPRYFISIVPQRETHFYMVMALLQRFCITLSASKRWDCCAVKPEGSSQFHQPRVSNCMHVIPSSNDCGCRYYGENTIWWYQLWRRTSIKNLAQAPNVLDRGVQKYLPILYPAQYLLLNKVKEIVIPIRVFLCWNVEFLRNFSLTLALADKILAMPKTTSLGICWS